MDESYEMCALCRKMTSAGHGVSLIHNKGTHNAIYMLHLCGDCIDVMEDKAKTHLGVRSDDGL